MARIKRSYFDRLLGSMLCLARNQSTINTFTNHAKSPRVYNPRTDANQGSFSQEHLELSYGRMLFRHYKFANFRLLPMLDPNEVQPI